MKSVFQYFAQCCELPRLVLSMEEVDKILDPPEPRQIDPIVINENDASPLRRLHSTVQQSSKQFVTLPHTATHKWKDLCLLMSFFIIASLFAQVSIFFVPLNSVEQGIEGNRGFQYGVLSFYQFLGLLPWVETCNYAMPEAKIPIKSRIATVVLGVLAQYIFGLLVYGKVFPFPFSTLVTGTAALLVAIPALILMTPNLKEHWAQWKLCLLTLRDIAISIFLAASWAAAFVVLEDSMWQTVIAFLFVPFQVFCKNILVAPTAVKLNRSRYVTILLVVDMIFARFQVETLPKIKGYSSLPVLILVPAASLFFRFYSGPDRLILLFGSYFKKMASNDGTGINIIENRLGTKGLSQMGINMIGCTCSAVHEMSLQVHRSKRNLSTELTLYQDWCSTELSEGSKADVTVNDDEESDRSIKEDALTIHKLEESLRNSSLGSIGEMEEEIVSECLGNKSEEGHEEGVDVEMGTIMVNIEVQSHDDDQQEDLEMGIVDEPTDREGDTMSLESDEEAPVSSLFMDPVEPADSLDSEEVEETWWMQRQTYHIVESVGSELLTTFVQFQNQIALTLLRSLPIREHLNKAYDVSSAQWNVGITYGWVQIAVNILVIAILGGYCFRSMEKLGERELRMSAICSYIFRDNFWFLFLWITAIGALAIATFIEHFGYNHF
jgi:hypothetical protein